MSVKRDAVLISQPATEKATMESQYTIAVIISYMVCLGKFQVLQQTLAVSPLLFY